VKRVAVVWVALGMAGLLLYPTWAGDVKVVKPVKEWKGYFPDNKDIALKKEAPAGGRVTNEKEWAKLWKAWRGKEELPKVDFDKELVFAYAAGGPNTIVMNFRLDGQGDLSARFSATEKGGPGFVYKIVTLKRDGVKTINGKPLGK
jgi:hypothetical protein